MWDALTTYAAGPTLDPCTTLADTLAIILETVHRGQNSSPSYFSLLTENRNSNFIPQSA